MADTYDPLGESMIPARPEVLRLYRGLTKAYDPARVSHARMSGTDFTDCPFTALGYARGPKGVVLVLEAPLARPRVSEELWLVTHARRFMVWGAFDDLIVAQLSAKELRAHVRRKGVVSQSDAHKAWVLRCAIDAELRPDDWGPVA